MTEADDIDSSLIVNCVFNVFLSHTAIMLNITTIHALRKTSSLPKPLKTLLLSLAVSDLGVGLLVQPLYVAHLVMRLKENTENNPTYNIKDSVLLHITANLFSYASFFGVTALTADRFLAVHLHLRYQELVTHRRVVAVVISVWVLSAFLSPPFELWIPKISAHVWVTIATVCFIFTAFVYCKIYLAVRRHANEIQVLQVQQVTQNGEVMANTARLGKYAVATFYVFLVFLGCYLPSLCLGFVSIISGKSTIINTSWHYTLTLVFLNSSLNPLVYCWKMRHIRHAVMDVVRNCFSRQT